jgi:mannose/fructose/N-acetylgalactosamine-specific phosphotransferase system component IID
MDGSGDGSQGSVEMPEKGPAALLGVVVFVIIAMVMIAMVIGSGIGGSFVGLWIFALIVIVIFVIARYAIAEKTPETSSGGESTNATREVRIETIRETVKVRCRYCGTLNLETDTKCQSCGGNL